MQRRALPLLLLPLALVAAVLGWLAFGRLTATRAAPPLAALRLTPMPTLSGRVDFALQDTEGAPRSLANYGGKVVVLYFGFTRCPDACPTELFKLAKLTKRLGTAAARLQVLLVTLDPERDSPRLLDNYVKAFDPAFGALTGTAQQIAGTAKAFFVVYSKQAVGNDYTIDHSTGTYIIDVDRREVLYATSATPVDDFAHDIGLLLAQKP